MACVTGFYTIMWQLQKWKTYSPAVDTSRECLSEEHHLAQDRAFIPASHLPTGLLRPSYDHMIIQLLLLPIAVFLFFLPLCRHVPPKTLSDQTPEHSSPTWYVLPGNPICKNNWDIQVSQVDKTQKANAVIFVCRPLAASPTTDLILCWHDSYAASWHKVVEMVSGSRRHAYSQRTKKKASHSHLHRP